MSSAVMPLQSGRDHWTDGLMLNKHGVPLGNLRNVLHALRNAPEWQWCPRLRRVRGAGDHEEAAAVERSNK